MKRMYVDRRIFHLLLHYYFIDRNFKRKCTFSKILEHPETTENIEMQLITHDIDEKQIDLSQHHSGQSIQCEEKYPNQRYYLNSPSRVDKVVQHFKTSSMNKCQNSQGESDTNITDSGDKEINVSSEESEWYDICKK